MAKAATKAVESPEPPKKTIATLEQADAALEELGRISDRIAVVEARERESIRSAQDRIKKETAEDYLALCAIEAALEEFATKQRKKIFSPEAKSLELRFGKIGFRFTPWKIEFIKGMTEDVILDKLKANRLKPLIRLTESINKQAALQMEDEKLLEKCGLEKTREELFYYQLAPRAPAAPFPTG